MLNLEILKGNPKPLGSTFQGNEINFAIYSSAATSVTLGLFRPGSDTPEIEIPLEKTDSIWHVAIRNFKEEGMTYAFRASGPYEESKGHLFKETEWLADPYAKKVSAGNRAKLENIEPFDWQGVQKPNLALSDLVLYEMHVRGFTKHASSNTKYPGTFLGMIEKIPYLKDLGVNAIELMPVFGFNEREIRQNPKTKECLKNYWGYHTLHFFSLMPTYAQENPIEEFKTLVRELHRNGIEIILDVVYNHTGEGSEKNFYVNFRGLDNKAYYLWDKGSYLDFTGCGNTVNANETPMLNLIIDSLRYWAEEMQVDGFRFDLASALTRDSKGLPLSDPPLFKAMATDPVIQKAKLIAEPWDPKGLYQQGFFAKLGPWCEWNDFYRLSIRRFLKGAENQSAFFAKALSGSKDPLPSPLSGINFITCHDGFCLRDLVSYNEKHNEENGEECRDGADGNESWNSGIEGSTDDPKIQGLREMQMRNFFLALFISQGTPMLLMGDEYGHTRRGNNNAYLQDNELNWFLWDKLNENMKIFDFVSSLIHFRKSQAEFHVTHFFSQDEIEWHGIEPHQPDWAPTSKFVAFSLKKAAPPLYVAFNASAQTLRISLPPNIAWKKLVRTVEDWDQHQLRNFKKAPAVSSPVELPPYSALLLIG